VRDACPVAIVPGMNPAGSRRRLSQKVYSPEPDQGRSAGRPVWALRRIGATAGPRVRPGAARCPV